ncbi:MAG: hypothetical protein WCK78_06870 [Paludibacter sp.]
MKQNLIFALFILSLTTNGIGQTTSKISTMDCSNMTQNSSYKYGNDSLPTVELTRQVSNVLTPVYYINGIKSNSSFLRTFNPKFIDSIRVDKKEIKIDNTKHYGQIYVKTKSEYNPKLISLTELKQKYTKQSGMSTIFMIDNDIIKENYPDYFVDEKYILKIIVDILENKKEKLHVQIIRLITRTDENIKQANEIIIRGNNEQLK